MIAAIRRHKKIYSLFLLLFCLCLSFHFLAHLDPDHGQEHTQCLMCHFFKLMVLFFAFTFFLSRDTEGKARCPHERFLPIQTVYLPYRRHRGPPAFAC